MGSLDWSSCSHRFRLALHALQRDDDAFFKTLPAALMAKEVTPEQLQDWPLFDPLRGLDRWKDAVGVVSDDHEDEPDAGGIAALEPESAPAEALEPICPVAHPGAVDG